MNPYRRSIEGVSPLRRIHLRFLSPHSSCPRGAFNILDDPWWCRRGNDFFGHGRKEDARTHNLVWLGVHPVWHCHGLLGHFDLMKNTVNVISNTCVFPTMTRRNVCRGKKRPFVTFFCMELHGAHVLPVGEVAPLGFQKVWIFCEWLFVCVSRVIVLVICPARCELCPVSAALHRMSGYR